MYQRLAVVATAATLWLAPSSFADTENWDFDITTSGENVFYNSPTPVDPAALRYAATTEISLIEVNITFIGTFTIDVTDQLELDELTGVRVIDGPAPTTVFDEQVLYPEPPEDPGIAADITLELDADGFGSLSAVDITLDTVEVDIPGFGLQNVAINSLRVAGNVIITPIPAGDTTLDGRVDLADLLQVIGNWGSSCPTPDCPDTPCPGDANGDCVVNLADLLAVIGNWGTGCE